MTTADPPVLFAQVTRHRVLIGRIMAATAVLLAVYAILALSGSGRIDLFLGEWVPQMILPALGFGTLAWLALPLQPSNRALWATTWGALLTGIAAAGWATSVVMGSVIGAFSPSHVNPVMAVISLLYDAAGWPGIYLILTLGFLLFPDGEFPSRRWRWAGWLSISANVALMATFFWVWRPNSAVPYETEVFTGVGRLVYPLIYLLILLSCISVSALVLGYRRSSGATRQQFRWIAWGGTLLVLSIVAVAVAEIVPGVPRGAWERAVIFVGVAILIACYGVAVTRFRLYDIDLVISRTLIYGTLAAFIGVVYVVVVVGVGSMFGSGAGNLGLSVAATALVAIAFEPVRRRVQGWANRMVFGRRASPYEVLAELAHRLAGAEAPELVLNRMARLMAEGTGAEQTAVWLSDGNGLVVGAGWPQTPPVAQVDSLDQLPGVAYPVVHDRELVGALQVVKSRGSQITPVEQRLISDLAGSAGLVLGNQRLNAALAARADELQASRRRLVEAQDTERRRLERNLHDGAQQEVVALKVQIRLLEQVARDAGAEDIAGVLSEMAGDAQAAVDEIRSLARGLYPPLLESEGLEAAVASQAQASPIRVEVKGGRICRHPKDIESAIYFAVAEAMTNAVKHARPSHIDIILSDSDGALMADVADDGVGFDPYQAGDGMGLVNIRDRVEALGGEVRFDSAPGAGTRMVARIPIGERSRIPNLT